MQICLYKPWCRCGYCRFWDSGLNYAAASCAASEIYFRGRRVTFHELATSMHALYGSYVSSYPSLPTVELWWLPPICSYGSARPSAVLVPGCLCGEVDGSSNHVSAPFISMELCDLAASGSLNGTGSGREPPLRPLATSATACASICIAEPNNSRKVSRHYGVATTGISRLFGWTQAFLCQHVTCSPSPLCRVFVCRVAFPRFRCSDTRGLAPTTHFSTLCVPAYTATYSKVYFHFLAFCVHMALYLARAAHG